MELLDRVGRACQKGRGWWKRLVVWVRVAESRRSGMAALAAVPTTAVAGEIWEWIGGLQENREAHRARNLHAHLGCVPTPPQIARSMARRLMQPGSGPATLRVLDAGCGTATLLTTVVREACRHDQKVLALGIEQDGIAARWAAGLEHLVRRAAGSQLLSWTIRHADFLLDDEPQTFDRIIANPPYVTLRSLPVAQRRKLQQTHPQARGDLAVLFVQRMLDLLRPGGRLCVIVPNKLLATTYAEPLRRRLLDDFQVREVHDLSRSNAFPGVGAYPVILVIERSSRRQRIQILEADTSSRFSLAPADVRRLPGALVPLDFPPELIGLVNRLRRLGTLGEAVPVHCGIAVSGFGRAIGRGSECIIQSGDVQRFRLRPAKPFDPQAAGIELHRLVRQRVEKIVVPGMFQELCAARSPATQLLGRVYYMPVGVPGRAETRQRAALLLALLNSRFYRVLYRGLFDAVSQAGGWLRLNGPYLESLPWPVKPAPSRLIADVGRAEQADCPALRELLDALIEELFGLTPAERRAVESLQAKQHWKVLKGGPEASRRVAPRGQCSPVPVP